MRPQQESPGSERFRCLQVLGRGGFGEVHKAEDSKLGGLRNHAPETASLVESVGSYVEGLDNIDFSGCPEDFTAAFRSHRDAWERSIPR